MLYKCIQLLLFYHAIQCINSYEPYSSPLVPYSSGISSSSYPPPPLKESSPPPPPPPPYSSKSSPYSSNLEFSPIYADPPELHSSASGEEPLSFSIPLPKAFSGALEPNNLLSQATKMFENVIIGPTSLAIYKDYLYTGTAGGGVYRGNLRTGNATRIAKIANELCDSKPWDASVCGRPLGIRVDSKGTVYYVDAYLGLHVIDFVGSQVKLTRLLSLEDVGGKYMGHLVIDEGAGVNGGNVIYITIASSKRDLTQWTGIIIEPDRTGFVVRFDADSGQHDRIMQGLWYPASIELTDDRSAVLVAEFSARRVVKHYIKGPKKGVSEPWAENLPGEADHLIRSEDKSRETYWMVILNARNVSSQNLLDWMSDKPWLRQEILEQYSKIGNNFEELGQQWKNERLDRLGFQMKAGFQFYSQNVANNYGLLLEFDGNGKIIGSIHSTDGRNSLLSEAVEGPSDNPSERVLYLGSFVYPYVLRLVVKKPIYDLPLFQSLSGDNIDRPQALEYKAIGRPLTYDQLKYVDIPALLKNWQNFQGEKQPDY